MPKVAMTLAAVAAVWVLSGCASRETAAADSKAYRSCFLPSDVAGWKDSSGGKINFRTLRGEFYQAQFLHPCPNADWSQELTLITRHSLKVCEGEDATLVIPGPLAGPQSCRIDDVRKMTAEEVAALRPIDRP